MAKKLLSLSWSGDDGVVYAEQQLAPRAAREVIAAEIVSVGGYLWMGGMRTPLWMLTHAAVTRRHRAPVVRLADGRECVINAV